MSGSPSVVFFSGGDSYPSREWGLLIIFVLYTVVLVVAYCLQCGPLFPWRVNLLQSMTSGRTFCLS